MIQLFLFTVFFANPLFADNLQTYKERERAFSTWLEHKNHGALEREKAIEKQKLLRAKREIAEIRRREQFQRVYRTTAPLEAEYLRKAENREEKSTSAREIFSQKHKALLHYYEENVLPLKDKEYGVGKYSDLGASQ